MKTTIRLLCLAPSIAFAFSAGAAFKCVDEKGLTHVGDTPPEPCAKVIMYEVSRSGSVLRKIDPSLTTEQAKARAEADERRKESDKAASELKRKDLALLATYSTESEFDVVRDRTIEPIKGRIKIAQERVAAIDKRIGELDDEMEFYRAGKSSKSARTKKSEAPVMLTSDLERLNNEKQILVKNIASSEREIAQMLARFEIDKKRWMALKSRGGPTAADAPVAEAKPEVKPVKKTN